MNFFIKNHRNLRVLCVSFVFYFLVFLPPKLTAQWGTCPVDWQYSFFDWQSNTFQMYYGAPNVAVAVPNPYHAYGGWLNENISELAFPANKDYDGWVHLAHDFGTSSTPTSNPYLFLYNWKSGMLRTFFLITNRDDDYNSASVNVSFGNVGGNKRSAVLSSLQGNNAINAVQRFENGEGVGVNKWQNQNAYWLMSDFPMMYDPCTCQMNGLESKLYIEARLSKTQTVQASVNGQALQKFQPVTAQNSTSIGRFLKPTATGLTNIAEIQKSRKEYLSLFENDAQGNPKIPSWLTQYATLLGPVGKFLGFADFLMGIINPTATVTPKPLAFEVKLDVNGSITWQGGFQNVIMSTPGTSEAGSDPNLIGKNIADFNNVMGTFNLLKVPKVKMTQNILSYNYEDEMCVTQTVATRFECAEPLKYVHNQFLSFLGNIRVEASYIIEYANGTKVITPSFPIGCFADYKYLAPANLQGLQGWCFPMDFCPIGCKIQIYAEAPDGNGGKVVFLRTYNVDVTLEGSVEELVEVLPNSGCSDMSPASLSEISDVCNSSEYISKRNQSVKNPITQAEYIANFEKAKAERLAAKNRKLNEENAIEVYPNPTTNSATISFDLKSELSRVNLYLTDVSGKIMFNWLQQDARSQGKHSFKFERNDLAAGLYFIVLETEQGKVVKKLF